MKKLEKKGGTKAWFLYAALISFVIFIMSSFFGFGRFLGFGGISGYLFLLASIVLLIVGLAHRSHDKVYKENSPPKEMNVKYIFYIVGILFIFASVVYFAREFIAELPDMIKLVLLIVSVVVTFVVAELLRGGDK